MDYEAIKQRVRITDVLRSYGCRVYDRQSYRIPCPIHKGKDANFSVSERNGLWNCFSVCGRGGSVLDLVAALENISIPDAAEKLSKEFDVSEPKAMVLAAHKLNSQMEQWQKLQSGIKTTDLPDFQPLEIGYRGFTKKTIEHWRLGRTDEGVLITLVNSKGQPCSYSIRRNDSTPKYKHAAGMPKGVPFGLYQNSKDIIDAGFCYVVEGQLDAIAMWQRGYKNVVAIMGSVMSEQQAMLLLSLTSSLTLVMDGDDAGRKAAKEIQKKWGKVFSIRIFNLPEGVDPDEYKGVIE